MLIIKMVNTYGSSCMIDYYIPFIIRDLKLTFPIRFFSLKKTGTALHLVTHVSLVSHCYSFFNVDVISKGGCNFFEILVFRFVSHAPRPH